MMSDQPQSAKPSSEAKPDPLPNPKASSPSSQTKSEGATSKKRSYPNFGEAVAAAAKRKLEKVPANFNALKGQFDSDSDEDQGPLPPVASKIQGFNSKPQRQFAMSSGSVNLPAFDPHFSRIKNDERPPQPIVVVSKPTILLASIPLNTPKPEVESLVAACGLKIDALDLFVPAEVEEPGSSVKVMLAAVVILHRSTSDQDIAAAVDTLNGKYFGKGYFLWAKRHRSTAAMAHKDSRDILLPSALKKRPFGAHRVAVTAEGFTVNSEPESEGTVAAPPGGTIQNVVFIKRPHDKELLMQIHRTIEQCLKYGQHFECGLMEMPQFQKDEKWSWLWDKRSDASNYYLWRMWELQSGFSTRSNPEPGRLHRLIEGDDAPWFREPSVVRFEFVTDVSELREHPDWEVMMKAHADFGDHDPADDPLEDLNPYRRCRLIWTLAGLPRTMTKLRVFHVLSIIGLCFEWISCGPDEIVDILITNVVRPYNITSRDFVGGAWHFGEPAELEKDRLKDAELDPNEIHPDYSSAMMVGMAVLDLLLTNSRARHIKGAEKYEPLVESGLVNASVFKQLGEIPKTHNLSFLASERWRSKLLHVLGVWKNAGFFKPETYRFFEEQAGLPPAPQPKDAQLDPDSSGQGGQQSHMTSKQTGAQLERNRDNWQTFSKNPAQKQERQLHG